MNNNETTTQGWLEVLETIAAPNKVTLSKIADNIYSVQLELLSGFGFTTKGATKLQAILHMLCRLAGLQWVELRTLVALVCRVERVELRVLSSGEFQLVVHYPKVDRVFAGDTIEQAALLAFKSSKVWVSVDKAARFARQQAHINAWVGR